MQLPAMARTMAIFTLVFFAGVVASSAADASQQQTSTERSISGVQKVIQMLTDMAAKAKQEKKAEEVEFAKFTTWCSQGKTGMQKEIKRNAEDIELLEADIGKLQSDVRSLGEALTKLNTKVGNMESNTKSEKAQREEDHAEFLEEEKDYSESVDALDRAIVVMKQQDYDRKGTADALLQVSSKDKIPDKARNIMVAFATMMNGGAGKDDKFSPEANGYEFQSSSIVDMLSGLKDDFKNKLGECQKEEMNSKHAFDMIITDLTDSIENSQKEIEEKTLEKQRKTEKAALDKKQLASTVNVKAQNEKTMGSMGTECSEKNLSFAEKQKLRKEEIEAIEKATEILASPDVSDNADKHLALLQTRRGTALMQLGEQEAESTSAMGIRRRVRDFLATESHRLHSQRLGLLAEQMAANPFGKVMKMIDSMVKRLMEEANEDAQHEGFCDTEMGKSKITRTKLSEDIDGLSAAVEDGKATITQLTESTAELTKEVEDLVKGKAEASDLRQEEKAKNKDTVKDAKAAQAAVQRATQVLKDFYEKSLTATALVQGKAPSPRQWGLKTGVKMGTEEWKALANPDFEGTVDKGHKEGMQTFGESYEGNQDQGGGVLALLEVIQSDFANLEADTVAAEAESQKSHDKFMVESKRNQAVKEKKISMNNADRATAESKLQEDISNLKATQDELLAADRYHAKLVPQCIDQGMTFEERTAARKAEIDSLKEALKILNSEDIA